MNADTDDFEQRLRAQPPRTLPSHWRTAILREALAALPANSEPIEAAPVAVRNGAWSRIAEWTRWLSWRRWWLRPWPIAWSSLAACWLAILVLDAAARPDAADTRQAQAAARSAAAYFSLLQQSWQGDPGERMPEKPSPRPGSQGSTHFRRNDCYA